MPKILSVLGLLDCGPKNPGWIYIFFKASCLIKIEMNLAFLKDRSFLELENGPLNFLSSGSNSIQVSTKSLFLPCHSDPDLDLLFFIFASISLC